MIKSVEIKNVRNISNLKVNFEAKTTVITGRNGAGKTSILESIYIIATTKSFRNTDEKEVISKTKPYCAIKLTTDLNMTYEVIISDYGKRTLVNKKEIKKISDYIGKLRFVIFAPEDLMLIKGSPSDRRYFLDIELTQLNKDYLKELNTYKKILKQRNILLKKIKLTDDFTFLNILSDQLYDAGSKIYDYRKAFIERINEIINVSPKLIEPNQLKISYAPSISKKDFLSHLKTKQITDITYQQTTQGIHKDDFKIVLSDNLAKDYASQGLVRLIAIELKLALLKIIQQDTSDDVILLLDDVLSELDEMNIQKLYDILPNVSQSIITSAYNINNKNINTSNIKYIHLEKGEIYNA